MKKILFATTALVATAGVAAAEVSFGGYGRFGIKYVEGSAAVANTVTQAQIDTAANALGAAVAAFDAAEQIVIGAGNAATQAQNDAVTAALAARQTAQAAYDALIAGNAVAEVEDMFYITSRFRLNIDADTETDSGVTLDARIRIQADSNADGTAGEGGFNGARFGIETGGLRVEVGNISGVIDSGNAMNFYGHGVGLTSIVEQSNSFGGNIIGYTSTGAGVNGASVLYSMNGFSVMAAFTQNDGNATLGDQWEIGAGYEFGDWNVGAAVGAVDRAGNDDNYWMIGADGNLGVAKVAAVIGDSDNQDDMSYGISASFDAGAATSVQVAISGGGNDANDTAYGIGARHDLGGGASLRGGIGRTTAGKTTADFGVLFNF